MIIARAGPCQVAEIASIDRRAKCKC